MAKRKPDPRKITVTKLLRLLKKAASEHGATFKGLDGCTHYLFEKNGALIRAPRTPRVDENTVLKRFRTRLERAT